MPAPDLEVPVIDRFRGRHFYMSNFYPAPTPYSGHVFPTSEHAYMAARTRDDGAIAAILATDDPAEAQHIGRAAPLVQGWDRARFKVMEDIVAAKFKHNPDIAEKLVATTGVVLVEGNDWHDQTWGSCLCPDHRSTPGENVLGIILMAVRIRLRATSHERKQW